MDIQEWELFYYQTGNHKIPFKEWFESIRDVNAKAVIDAKIRRLSSGNFGNCKSVGSGVMELKIDYGPGHRVYFARAGRQIILLLCGGDKGTQKQDIQTAHAFWQSYRKENL